MSPEHLEAYSPHHDRRPEEARRPVRHLRPGRDPVGAVGRQPPLCRRGHRERLGDDAGADDRPPAAGRAHGRAASASGRLPPGLREAPLRRSAPQPAARYASAGDLAGELSLCLNPDVCAARQRQLGRWHDLAMRYPLSFATVVAVLPNVVLSLVNVNYDWFAIVAPRLPPSAQWAFVTLITLFKALLYAIGLTVGVSYVLPVFVPFRRPVDAERLRRAR